MEELSKPGPSEQIMDPLERLAAEVARQAARERAAEAKAEQEAAAQAPPTDQKPDRPSKDALKAISKEFGTKEKPVPWPLNWSNLQSLASSYDDEVALRCFWWLYETGQRVSEGIGTSHKNVNLEVLADGREYLEVTSITEKSKKRSHTTGALVRLQTPWRVIPVPLFGREKPITEKLWAEISQLKPEEPVLPGDRFAVNYRVGKAEIITRAFDESADGGRGDWIPDYRRPCFPHYLRHVRATHLANDPGNSFGRQPDAWLQKFFGWKSAAMPGYYAQFGGKELIEAIM